jgi:Putative transposase
MHASRTALLLAFDGERVPFRWKDYAHGNKQKKMTPEFLRRFIQHILPRGFVRAARPLSSESEVALFRRILKPGDVVNAGQHGSVAARLLSTTGGETRMEGLPHYRETPFQSY